MASGSNVRAGGAFVEIFSDNSRLVKGLKQAQSMISGWAGGLRSLGSKIAAPLGLLGVTGAAGLLALGTQIADMGGAIDDVSQRTGLSVEAVSELGHAAQMSGTDMETLEGSLARMQNTVTDAAAGSKAANAALADLGLTAEELQGLSPDEQFARLADGVASIEDPAQRTAAAMGVFGKAGQKLIPLLSGGAAGVEALRSEVRGMISGSDVAAAAELGDSIDALKGSIKAAAFSVGAAFAPALTMLAKNLSAAVGWASKWIRDNRNLILMAVAGVAGLAGLGVAIWGVGAALSVVSMAIGAVITLWGALGAAIAFLVSPIGLVIVALVGLGAWFFTMTDAGRSALGWLSEAFGTLRSDATTAWGGIVAAIQAGDLQTAFEVAMAFLRLQWVRLTNFLEDKWLDFKGFFVEFWSAATNTFAHLVVDAAADFETVFVNAFGFLQDAWTNFTTKFMNGWRTAQNFVGKGFAWLIAKMEGLDPNEVMAEMDADLARRNNSASQDAQATLGARQQARDQRLAGIDATRQGSHDELNADLRRGQDERSRRRSAADEEQNKALADAQAKLAAAAEKANKQQADAATGTKPGTPPVAARLAAGAERSTQVATASDIRTAEGLKQILSAFGGGGADQQTAQNTARTAAAAEQTAANTAEVKQEVDRLRRESGDDVVGLEGGS